MTKAELAQLDHEWAQAQFLTDLAFAGHQTLEEQKNGSRCKAAETCVLDIGCPFVLECNAGETEGLLCI